MSLMPAERAFFRLEKAVREITGMEHVIPAHQGRGAEKILLETFRGKGDCVVSNMLFDTTRANAELCGLKAQDLPCQEFYDTRSDAPFKGNIHLEKLENFFKRALNRSLHHDNHQQFRGRTAGFHGKHRGGGEALPQKTASPLS